MVVRSAVWYSTVNNEIHTADPARCRAQQKKDCVGDIGCITQSPKRHVVKPALNTLRPVVREIVTIDKANAKLALWEIAAIYHGRIRDYEFYTGNDGKNWHKPVSKGKWRNTTSLQTVRFDKPIVARYIRLVSLSGVTGEYYTSVAEIDIIANKRLFR